LRARKIKGSRRSYMEKEEGMGRRSECVDE
jgi:hypothetical protein